MKQSLLYIFSILLLVGTSCSKEEPGTQFNVNTDFLIDMKEELSPTGGTLLFNVKTVNNQDCLDTGIDYSFNRNPTNITLSFLDLLVPEDCVVGNAPAKASINTGDLAILDYRFKIDLREEIESNGVLNVLADRYIVSFSEASGFEFIEKTLMRVPRHTIWGYVNHGEDNEETAIDFISNLATIASPMALEEGYYGWFKVANNRPTEMENLPVERFNSLFVFEYDGTDEVLENFIANFRSENENVDIALFNWEGKSF